MKKTLCILLSVLIFVGLFSGCAREKKPLRVLVDADAREFSQDSCKAAMDEIMLVLASEGGPSDIVVEVLPDYG